MAWNSLTWLESPYDGTEKFTFIGANGEPCELPHKYPGVEHVRIVEAEEVRPNLFHTAYKVLDFHFCDRIDLYTVVDPGERALFIDSGHFDMCGVGYFDRTLESAQVTWENAEIFLTHLHDDHDGNVPYCLKKGMKCVYRGPFGMTSKQAVDEFFALAGIPPEEQQRYRPFLEMHVGQAKINRWSAPEITEVCTGAVLDRGGYHFEVLQTPGHTPDHVCLVEPEQRFMFAGDHVTDAAPGHMQFFSGLHLVKRFLDSFDVLRAYDLECIYMSHHEPLEGKSAINAFYDKIVASYDKPVAKFDQLLRENGTLGVYEAAELNAEHKPGGLAGQPTLQRMRRNALALGYLEYLVDLGRATFHTADNGALIFETAK